MDKLQISVKKLYSDALLPVYATDGAAGCDLYLYADTPVTIPPGATVLLHTGLAFAIPEGYGGFVFARSGLAAKRGLAPANKVGVIDSDYRGEVMIAMHNASAVSQTLESGERIAQMVFLPVSSAAFAEVDDLESTLRGSGGFGSTGTRR